MNLVPKSFLLFVMAGVGAAAMAFIDQWMFQYQFSLVSGFQIIHQLVFLCGCAFGSAFAIGLLYPLKRGRFLIPLAAIAPLILWFLIGFFAVGIFDFSGGVIFEQIFQVMGITRSVKFAAFYSTVLLFIGFLAGNRMKLYLGTAVVLTPKQWMILEAAVVMMFAISLIGALIGDTAGINDARNLSKISLFCIILAINLMIAKREERSNKVVFRKEVDL